MSSLQSDVRLYVRKARKTRGQILSFEEFNAKFKTDLPVNEFSSKHQKIDEQSYKS